MSSSSFNPTAPSAPVIVIPLSDSERLTKQAQEDKQANDLRIKNNKQAKDLRIKNHAEYKKRKRERAAWLRTQQIELNERYEAFVSTWRASHSRESSILCPQQGGPKQNQTQQRLSDAILNKAMSEIPWKILKTILREFHDSIEAALQTHQPGLLMPSLAEIDGDYRKVVVRSDVNEFGMSVVLNDLIKSRALAYSSIEHVEESLWYSEAMLAIKPDDYERVQERLSQDAEQTKKMTEEYRSAWLQHPIGNSNLKERSRERREIRFVYPMAVLVERDCETGLVSFVRCMKNVIFNGNVVYEMDCFLPRGPIRILNRETNFEKWVDRRLDFYKANGGRYPLGVGEKREYLIAALIEEGKTLGLEQRGDFEAMSESVGKSVWEQVRTRREDAQRIFRDVS